MYGVSNSFLKLRKLHLIKHSRFINNEDVKNHLRVIVLGNKLKVQIFGNQSALGKKIRMDNVVFTIIGVIKKARETTYSWYDDSMMIPYSTYITLWGNRDITYFSVLPKANIDSKQAEDSMRVYFAHKYHFDPNDKVALKVFSTTKFFQFFKWFFIGIQLFLGICGALTLGVGSLGVANIMFLIVTERTKEIGLRMAVGASDWQILMQILLEALIIVGLGGLIGFLIAYITVEALLYVPLPNWLGTPVMSFSSIVITILMLGIFGIVSGYFPAKRASKMDPVEALGFR